MSLEVLWLGHDVAVGGACTKDTGYDDYDGLEIGEVRK